MGRTRLIILLVVLSACGELAWCADPPRPAPPLANLNPPYDIPAGLREYADGLDALGKFDLAKADALFTEANARAPENLDILLSRGLARSLTDDREKIEQGVRDIERVYNTDRQRKETKRIYVYALARTGREVRLTDIYKYSSQDRFERLLQHGGSSAPGERGPFVQGPDPQWMLERRRRTVAQVFTLQQKQGEAMARVLFARGLERKRNKDFAGACQDLSIVVGQYPQDWTVTFHYAAALTSLGDFEKSRQIVSLALRWQPALAEAYSQRAMAASRMGGIERARQDLEIARQLDPDDTKKGARAMAEKIVAEDVTAMPKASAQELLKALLDQARKGQSVEELLSAAKMLVRAGNAKRLHGDERYQEKLCKLQWAVLTDPKNPDKLAKLGRFLLDEVDVRGEWIDPDQTFAYYRLQTRELGNMELNEARRLFGEGLDQDPAHVPSLVGMALIKFRETMYGDAEEYTRRAMQVRANDPEILDLMSRLMAIAAGQQYAQATMLTMTTRSTIETSTHIYIREEVPTAAAWAKAGEMFDRAGGLLSSAKAYTQAALKVLRDTPESCDYLGTFGFREKKYDVAIKAYERACQLVPNKIEFRYGAANAYSATEQFDGYLKHTTIGRNLEQTSTAAQLLAAWHRIGAGNLDTADPMLDEAEEIDAADARITAYRGVIAESKGQTDEATACYRAALAIELARLSLRGVPQLPGGGSSTCSFNDLALSVILRMRLARLLESTDPKSALALYEQNFAVEQRLGPADMLQIVPVALLPVANVPHKKPDAKRRSPRGGEVLRANSGRAAMLLYREGDMQQAAKYFRHIPEYDEYLLLAGASKYEIYDTARWGSGVAAASAADCLEKVGDAYEAMRWSRRQNQSEPADFDNSADTPQQSSPTPKRRGGFHR